MTILFGAGPQKIQDCISIFDLSTLIKTYTEKYPNFVDKYYREINTKVNEIISNGDGEWHPDESFLNCLFFHKKDINENDYLILEAYANSINRLREADLQDVVLMSLCTILMRKETLLERFPKFTRVCPNMDSIKNYILGRIMDFYVPAYDPSSLISDVFKPSLDELVRHAYDKDYIEQLLLDGNIHGKHINADAISVFNHLSDIYTNDEAKKEFIYNLHWIETDYESTITKAYEINDRYLKFFNNELSIPYIYQILASVNDEYFMETLHSQIAEIQSIYNLDINILICFIRDICALSNSQSQPPVDINAVINMIHQYFDKPSVFTNEDEKNDSSTITKESYTSYYIPEDGFSYAIESYDKNSRKMENAESKVYKAFKNYKNSEEKVDGQLTKVVNDAKNLFIGDTRTEIIEGKKFTVISLLKQILGTVGLFAFGPIKGIIALVVRYALKKNTTMAERKKIIMSLQEELEMLDEKIDDAKSDGDREAKYAMMRTRAELKNALQRVQYGLAADQRSIDTAKKVIGSIKH